MAKRKDKQQSTRHYTENKRSSNLQIYSVSLMFISYKYTNDKQTINKHRNLTSKYVEVQHSCIKAVMSRRSRLKCL